MNDEADQQYEWPFCSSEHAEKGRRAFVLVQIGPNLVDMGFKGEELVESLSKVDKWLETGAVATLPPRKTKLTVVKSED